MIAIYDVCERSPNPPWYSSDVGEQHAPGDVCSVENVSVVGKMPVAVVALLCGTGVMFSFVAHPSKCV